MAYKIAMETNNKIMAVVCLNNLGDIHRKMEQFDKALEYTFRCLHLAEELKAKGEICSAQKDLSKIYAAMGDYANAYHYLEEGRKLYEELFTEESKNQISMFQTLYEIEQKDQDIELLEQQSKWDRQLKIISLFFLVLIAGFGFLFYKNQNQKIKNNQKIIDQNKLIFKTELENERLKESQLNHLLELRNKELTMHTLNIIQKNKVLEELRGKLNLILEGDKTQRGVYIQELSKLIDRSANQDRDWKEFRKTFEQVHHSFFEGLKENYPDLTPGDLRICALIKLNINSGNMSTILGISQDSLRISRYRLRKKLRLDQGENLSTFIQTYKC